jgi:hypothetical protein
MAAAALSVPSSNAGNSAWAESYGRSQKQLVKDYAARAPRTLQKHLGPSELGEPCQRQKVMKMAQLTRVSNVHDPWASVMGTAGHAYVEDMYKWDNDRRIKQGLQGNWYAERRVCPDPDPATGEPGPFSHPGTADLYDIENKALVDHKFLGKTSLAKLVKHGPKTVYYIQFLLYRRGYQLLGYEVNRVVLLAWPRTESYLDNMYVWEHTPTAEDDALVDRVLAEAAHLEKVAPLVQAGHLNIMDIPASPSDDSCSWCPLYRPQSARDHGYGCPGTVK